MYDTLHFWIDVTELGGGNPFGVASYLTNVTKHHSDKIGYYCSGNIGNILVSCYNGGISIKGSLAKYILPSNVYTLDRHTASEALQKLSDVLHIDLMKAKVTRLDLSTVIPTKQPPKDYYRGLGNKPHFERLQASATTLYYNTSKRKLLFYDKRAEADFKGAEIPPLFKGCNLLRYELRLTSKIPKQMQINETVTGATLTQEQFYYKVVELWKNEYFTINKINFIDVADRYNTPKEAKTALFTMLLQQSGIDTINDYLFALRANKSFEDPKYYTRLKDELNKLMQAPTHQQGGLMQELDKAIKERAKYAR